MFKILIAMLVVQYVFAFLNYKGNKYMVNGAQPHTSADWIPFHWVYAIIKTLFFSKK